MSDCQHLQPRRTQTKLLIVFLLIWIPDLENIIIIITTWYVADDIGPVMPWYFNLWIILLCGSLSNALVKSRMAMSTDFFSSRDLLVMNSLN